MVIELFEYLFKKRLKNQILLLKEKVILGLEEIFLKLFTEFS